MDTAARKKAILDLLYKSGSVNVMNLSEKFNVSSMTIRRDLAQFAKEGIVTLEHGGAILVAGSLFEYSMMEKEKVYLDEKRRIASACLNYINDGDSVFLDAGTTTAEIAKLLVNSEKKISILSHSLIIANIFAQSDTSNYIMCPGIFRQKSMAFLGQMTDEFVSQFKIDKLFLGVEGVNVEGYVSVPDVTDGATKKQLINCSNKVYCVADSSKFKNDYMYKIAKANQIDLYITDTGLDSKIKEKAKGKKIRILTV